MVESDKWSPRLSKPCSARRSWGKHAAGGRVEVGAALAHHAFGEGEHDPVEFEQVDHRVVILKAVHPPDRRLRDLLVGGGVDFFQRLEQGGALLFVQLRFVLRRHLLDVDHVDQRLEQFGVGLQIRGAVEFEQVDLALHLAVLAVALDAVRREGRLNDVLERVRGGGWERQKSREQGDEEGEF